MTEKTFRGSQGSPGTGPWLELPSQTERQRLGAMEPPRVLLLPPGISAEVMAFCDSLCSQHPMTKIQFPLFVAVQPWHFV